MKRFILQETVVAAAQNLPYAAAALQYADPSG